MSIRTLSSGTKVVQYMPMTTKAIPCPAPILPSDFEHCQVPGGTRLWEQGGFYSPGQCFEGYEPQCTQVTEPISGWPIQKEETAVRCVPLGYKCNEGNKDPRFAVTNFGDDVVSAPAFEIRWRNGDLSRGPADSSSLQGDSEGWPTGTVTLATNTPSRGSETRRTDPGTTHGAESTQTSEPRYGNLSERAMIGITTGAVLGLLVLIAVLVIACKKQRRHILGEPVSSAGVRGTSDNATSQSQSQSQQPVYFGPAELPYDAELPSELASTQPSGNVRSLTNPTEMFAGYDEPRYAESAPAELSAEARHGENSDQETPKAPA